MSRFRRKSVLVSSTFVFIWYLHYSFTNNRHTFHTPLPLILLFTYNHSSKTQANICRGTRNGQHVVNFDRCPFKCEFSCRLADFKTRSPEALLFFGEDFQWPFKLTDRNRTSSTQRWIFWSWEAPMNHPEYTRSRLTFNWLEHWSTLLFSYICRFRCLFRTMTYRQDSDIVHAYGRSVARNQSHTIRDFQAVDFYLASSDNRSTFDIENEFRVRENRSVWFVSNCRARTPRNQIAAQLSELFPSDRFGQCNLSNRNGGRISTNEFERMLFKYKFYLAFENAHCEDYITEKAFYNALLHGSIPVVFGPTEENYRRILPPDSFVHVNHFDNLTQLADELTRVSNDVQRFAHYHRWRQEFRIVAWPSNYHIDDLFCNLCMKLHTDRQHKTYTNFSQWLNHCTP